MDNSSAKVKVKMEEFSGQIGQMLPSLPFARVTASFSRLDARSGPAPEHWVRETIVRRGPNRHVGSHFVFPLRLVSCQREWLRSSYGFVYNEVVGSGGSLLSGACVGPPPWSREQKCRFSQVTSFCFNPFTVWQIPYKGWPILPAQCESSYHAMRSM